MSGSLVDMRCQVGTNISILAAALSGSRFLSQHGGVPKMALEALLLLVGVGVAHKVMQAANDYDKEVFNGDIGFVRAVDPDAEEIVIDFDGRPVTYDFGELDEVSPAYATTIHKAESSEYPAVVIPLSTQH
jgi:ATP-dependent exoDNAse (exonuclease V) alpha subunit